LFLGFFGVFFFFFFGVVSGGQYVKFSSRPQILVNISVEM
jgi:hypothetical protein